jgi:hypothetical protein
LVDKMTISPDPDKVNTPRKTPIVAGYDTSTFRAQSPSERGPLRPGRKMCDYHTLGPWFAVQSIIPVEIAVCTKCGYVAQREATNA